MKSSEGAAERQFGKQWLEFLALELGMNTVQLKDEIYKVNNDVRRKRRMSSGTLKGQFIEERRPSQDFQDLVRATISKLIADGKIGNWRESTHSYDAFRSDGPVITSPMRFDRHHLRSVPSYIGSFVLIRSSYDDRIDVDYLSVFSPLPSAIYPIEWWKKELVDGRDDHLLHRGFGYLSNRQFGIEVARALIAREARVVKMSISRNDNDHPSRLVGVKLGCCAIDGAPLARRVYLIKVADQAVDERNWRRLVMALEADIAEHGPGKMEFAEAHARNSAIRDIPDRLAKVIADMMASAPNTCASSTPSPAARPRRRRA